MPMAVTQRVLTWFCMYPASKFTSRFRKNIYIIFTLAAFIGDLQSIAAAAMFFVKNASVDLGGSLYAVFQVCDVFGAAYAIPVGLFMQHKIRDLFESLSAIYENGKKSSFRILD